MLLSVILFIVLFLIYFILSVFIPKRYNYIFRVFITSCMMYTVGFRSMKVNNLETMFRYFHSDERVVCVMNHTSLYDPFMSICTLQCICGVFKEEGLRAFPFLKEAILNNSNCIMVKKGETTKMITEYVNKRKSGEEILIVYADGMGKIPEGSVIAPFKTGAFVPRCKVIPVVIKYKNYTIDPCFRWYNNDNIVWAQFRMFLDNSCDVEVDVLDPVDPGNMSIEQHRDRVHQLMEEKYRIM